MSFKGEVIADSSGKWSSNALRFKTKKEALAHVNDLAWRWTLVRETRVVRSKDPVNYAWIDNRAVPINRPAQASEHTQNEA